MLVHARERVAAEGVSADFLWAAGDPANVLVDVARDRSGRRSWSSVLPPRLSWRFVGEDVAAEVKRHAGADVLVVEDRWARTGDRRPPVAVVILVAAALAPLIVDLPSRLRFPAVVAEITLGILIGLQVLGFAEPDGVVEFLSTVGLAFLFFLVGSRSTSTASEGSALAARLAYFIKALAR